MAPPRRMNGSGGGLEYKLPARHSQVLPMARLPPSHRWPACRTTRSSAATTASRSSWTAPDHERLLALMADNAPRFGIAVHAYVLMDNHFHLLATPASVTGSAAVLMQAVRAQLRALLQRPPWPQRHLVGRTLQIDADPDRSLPADLHGLHRPEPGARPAWSTTRATSVVQPCALRGAAAGPAP